MAGVFSKHRFEVWNQAQHPYKHSLAEFAFVNPALPGVSNAEAALNWLLAVLYPQTKESVADVASLPAAGNAINDYRVVLDDGDGKAASYRWEQREGDVAPSWYKIYDMDWGADSILARFVNQTQDLYIHRAGLDQRDSGGATIAGIYAGQRIFGGASANTHLTLSANSGDGTGANTGYVQTTDHVRPVTDNELDLGTATEQFRNLYLGTSAVIDTVTIASGSITDAMGTIDFDDEHLVTTGNISGNDITASGSAFIGTMTITDGSITDTTGAIDWGGANFTSVGAIESGALFIEADIAISAGVITSVSGQISFGDEDLITTGDITAGSIITDSLEIDNILIDGNTISITQVDGNLNLAANGMGVIDLQSPITTLDITTTGDADISGSLDAGNLRLSGNTLSSTNANGNIVLSPNGTGFISATSNIFMNVDAAYTVGSAALRLGAIYIANAIGDGTNLFTMSDFMRLRNNVYRDSARTQPAQAGDALYYDAVSGTWLAAEPSGVTSHTLLSDLTTGDAGHTQFVMLDGRAGGQIVRGGTGASQILSLGSTTHATKGSIEIEDKLNPATDYSIAPIDLGSSGKSFGNLYLKGQLIGARVQNSLDAAVEASSGSKVGRLQYATDTKVLYVDTGAVNQVVATRHYVDTSWNGTDLTKSVDFSAVLNDCRLGLWQFCDNSNDHEILGVTITKSQTHVTITTDTPIPAGTYRLIGIV